MKKIILIALILIAILSVSAVQAAENVTEQIGNDADEVLTDNVTQKQDLNIEMYCPDNIIKPNPEDGEGSISFKNIPHDYENGVSIFIDNVQAFEGNPYYADSIRLSELEYGKHTILAKFEGTEKYNPLNLTHDVEVCEGYIYIPSEVTSESNVKLLLKEGATGTLTVNIDGKLYQKTEVLGESYSLSHAYVSLSSISKGTHSVEAIYSGDANNKKITKKQNVKFDFYVSIFIEEPTGATYNGFADNSYGSPYNQVVIYLSSDAKNTPVVRIDGEEYYVIKNEEVFSVNTSALKPGEHTINVTYPADSKYPQRSVEKTFKTICNVALRNGPEYRYNDTELCLLMPADAKGELNAYVDGQSYTCPVVNGTARIDLRSLKIGAHQIEAYYTGDDYNVSGIKKSITLLPKLIYPNKKLVNEPATFRIQVNPDANITIKVEFDANEFILPLVNGEGEFSITNLNLYEEYSDYNYINLEYTGDVNTTESPSVFLRMITYKLINAKDITMYYGDTATYTVTVIDDEGEKVDEVIIVRIGNNKYYPSAKNGVARLKITSLPGKYNVIATCINAKITTKLVVKQPLSLKAVTVKRSAKKLILQATLKKGKTPIKNKQITFKFAGKTYKAKTNKNGIAKVTVPKSVLSKLKVGKTVTYQATYLKDTVKKTAKVKK